MHTLKQTEFEGMRKNAIFLCRHNLYFVNSGDLGKSGEYTGSMYSSICKWKQDSLLMFYLFVCVSNGSEVCRHQHRDHPNAEVPQLGCL